MGGRVDAESAAEGVWVLVSPDLGYGAFSRHAAAAKPKPPAGRTDNQVKLQVPDAVRPELFIWLDADDGQLALAALITLPFDQTSGEIPVLELAPDVTDMWVASDLAGRSRLTAAPFPLRGHRWHRVVPPVLDNDNDQIEAMLACLVKTRRRDTPGLLAKRGGRRANSRLDVAGPSMAGAARGRLHQQSVWR
jgi:hypothetical protein